MFGRSGDFTKNLIAWIPVHALDIFLWTFFFIVNFFSLCVKKSWNWVWHVQQLWCYDLNFFILSISFAVKCVSCCRHWKAYQINEYRHVWNRSAHSMKRDTNISKNKIDQSVFLQKDQKINVKIIYFFPTKNSLNRRKETNLKTWAFWHWDFNSFNLNTIRKIIKIIK